MPDPENNRGHVDSPRPDERQTMRLARVLLLLAEAPLQPYKKPMDIERIAIYDFVADNPLLLFPEGEPQHDELLRAGFDPRSLSYHSASQRFANRRATLQDDLVQLLSLGLIAAARKSSTVSYVLTRRGDEVVTRLESSYADSYRASSRLISNKLNRIASTPLQARVGQFADARPFVIDLYGIEELA